MPCNRKSGAVTARLHTQHLLKLYPTKKKKCIQQDFLFFGSNISAISFIQFCSPTTHQFKSKNLFDSVQIIHRSVNKEGVKIKCHKCFNTRYGHHTVPDALYTADDCIDGAFLNLTICFSFVDVQYV